MTNAPQSPPASIRLRGHEPRPARITLEPRTRRTRIVRAALALGGFLLLAPIVFFVPPHIPWALLAVAAGVYFAYRQLAGEYVVHDFQARCPRCDAELKVETGEKIRLPLEMDCYQCHHKPRLEVG